MFTVDFIFIFFIFDAKSKIGRGSILGYSCHQNIIKYSESLNKYWKHYPLYLVICQISSCVLQYLNQVQQTYKVVIYSMLTKDLLHLKIKLL